MARSSDRPSEARAPKTKGARRLELDRVGKSFGPVVAVDDVSLAVEAGEFVSLLGPSGCGKSTTLAMIAGFEGPTRGEVRIDGERVNELPPQARRVGLVFQDYAIFTKMTVFDNLAYGLRARGLGRRETGSRVTAMAELLDLASVLTRGAAELNMSELQRVALGRVLVLEPAILLLDEPLSNLDAALRARLRAELRRLQQELRQTVIYVTHDYVEALTMSDRIAIMHQGRIQQVDTPEAVYNRPRTRFVAEFLGEPAMNVVPCDVDRAARALTVSGTSLRVPWRGRPVPEDPGPWLLGIRPHHVELRGRADGGDGADGEAPAEVELIQPLGAETAVVVKLGDQRLQALVPGSMALRSGDLRTLRIDPSLAHLFHGVTGEAA